MTQLPARNRQWDDSESLTTNRKWSSEVSQADRFAGTGVRPRRRAGPKVAEADPATSLGRCGEPLVSGERKAAGSVLVLPDCDNLVDGEVSVLESEHAGCEVEQPRALSLIHI